MKIKIVFNFMFITIIALFFSLKDASLQTNVKKQAEDTSQKAQYLVEQKKWAEAIEILEDGLKKCGIDDLAKECRGILNFSLGYLYHQRSDEDLDNKTVYLERAAENYQLALNGLPNNVQVMNNLALVFWSLGNLSEASNLFKKIVEIDEENRDAYWIALGDIYSEANRLKKALKYYKKASEFNPSNETPQWRILSFYRELPDDKIEELFQYSISLTEINQKELAKNGFEQVINRSFKTDNVLAEKALVLWAELGATEGWISEASLQALPDEKEWPTPAIRELKDLITNPEVIGNQLTWWNESLYRRHVAAFVMKSVGSQLLSTGTVRRSAEVYALALEVAPKFHRYDYEQELQKKPIVIFDIALELASIYHKYKTLDPQGRNFRCLEQELFGEKAIGYARKDLPFIQRMHTLLGLIYAERGQWELGGANNAVFQLDHAIRTAQRRFKKDPKNYQPLPHLQDLLADGYTKVGGYRQKDAFRTYIDAAIGYLELDALEKAEEMIERAEKAEEMIERAVTVSDARSAADRLSKTERRRLGEVKHILDSRQAISQLQEDNLDPESLEYFRKSRKHKWLYEAADLKLDTSFINRQRFKTFADLGDRASQIEKPQEAMRLQTHALEVIKNEAFLTNMEDIVRLEKIKNTVLNNVKIKKTKETIGTGYNLEKDYNYSKGKVWWMPSPSEEQPIQVGISSDLLLAGTIMNRVSNEPSLASVKLMLYLQDGQVTFLQEERTYEIIETATKLIYNIKGVREIKEPEKR